MGYARETELPCECRAKCSVQVVEVAVPFLQHMPDGWMFACGSRHWCRWPAKYCRFFQTRLEMMWRWNSQPDELYSWPCCTTNGSPNISRHRSYTTQTKEVKKFANFLLQFQRKLLAVVFGTAKNIRTTSQVTKYSLEPGPSRARYFPRDMLLLTTTARGKCTVVWSGLQVDIKKVFGCVVWEKFYSLRLGHYAR